MLLFRRPKPHNGEMILHQTLLNLNTHEQMRSIWYFFRQKLAVCHFKYLSLPLDQLSNDDLVYLSMLAKNRSLSLQISFAASYSAFKRWSCFSLYSSLLALQIFHHLPKETAAFFLWDCPSHSIVYKAKHPKTRVKNECTDPEWMHNSFQEIQCNACKPTKTCVVTDYHASQCLSNMMY